MSTIEIRNVSKTFGKNTALDGIDLTLRENCIYGLLGRNGAGKTTLLNIMTTRVFATSGEVLIDGESNIENDNALGKIYMMSEQLLYRPSLRVKEMFKVASYFYSDYDTEYALKLCGEYGLDPQKRLHSLSTGYRSIAQIINALSSGAPVIFLDEPVLGLDANHRDMFYRHVLERYSERPATYVISTHLIEEAANLIERAVIIRDGRLFADEDVETLRSMYYSASGKAADVESFAAGKEIIGSEDMGGFRTVYIKGPRPEGKQRVIETDAIPLQSLFIHLTNPSAEE